MFQITYFSGGVLTLVPKNGKDPTISDNYRGITVTPIIGKLFEKLLFLGLLETVNVKQSELRFGLTKDLSPTMSSLACSKLSMNPELKENHCIRYIKGFWCSEPCGL